MHNGTHSIVVSIQIFIKIFSWMKIMDGYVEEMESFSKQQTVVLVGSKSTAELVIRYRSSGFSIIMMGLLSAAEAQLKRQPTVEKTGLVLVAEHT